MASKAASITEATGTGWREWDAWLIAQRAPAVQHAGLASADDGERWRPYWKARLPALG